ncbi:hypothetical protein [Novimethylophilus kurashikiensis]|nr:hypothetical protein [Novimethylophilus kurashikiensis]
MAEPCRKRAWKNSLAQGHLEVCPWDSSEAVSFELYYAGMESSSATLTFTSRLLADQVCYALMKQFEAGKRAAKVELKHWLDS